MDRGPSPTQSDELRGLAWLVAAGLVGLVALVVSGLGGGPRASSARPGEEARATEVAGWFGTRWQGAPPPRAPALGSSPGVGLTTHAAGIEREDDPQMLAFEQSFRGDVDAGVPQPFSIAYHRGTLVSASGVRGVSPGASCEVRVLPVRSYEFNCLVRVTCDDVVIYPDDALRAGYAPCTIEGSEAVSAVDDSSTDGDREIDLDVRARSVVVQEHQGASTPSLHARVQLES
jgi:hypothetical protein